MRSPCPPISNVTLIHLSTSSPPVTSRTSRGTTVAAFSCYVSTMSWSVVVVIGADVLEVKLRFELGGLGLETAFAVVVVAVAVVIFNAADVDVAAVVVGAVSVVAAAVTVVAVVDVDVAGGGRGVDVLCAAVTPTPITDPEVERLESY